MRYNLVYLAFVIYHKINDTEFLKKFILFVLYYFFRTAILPVLPQPT